eukprot:gene1135-671_t
MVVDRKKNTVSMSRFMGDMKKSGPAQPTQTELISYAKYLGMDPLGDQDLLWIARDALLAPLPHMWSEHFDSEQRVFYYNSDTKQSSWTPPYEDTYREVYAFIVRCRNSPHDPRTIDEVARTKEQRSQKSVWRDPRPAQQDILKLRENALEMVSFVPEPQPVIPRRWQQHYSDPGRAQHSAAVPYERERGFDDSYGGASSSYAGGSSASDLRALKSKKKKKKKQRDSSQTPPKEGGGSVRLSSSVPGLPFPTSSGGMSSGASGHGHKGRALPRKAPVGMKLQPLDILQSDEQEQSPQRQQRQYEAPAMQKLEPPPRIGLGAEYSPATSSRGLNLIRGQRRYDEKTDVRFNFFDDDLNPIHGSPQQHHYQKYDQATGSGAPSKVKISNASRQTKIPRAAPPAFSSLLQERTPVKRKSNNSPRSNNRSLHSARRRDRPVSEVSRERDSDVQKADLSFAESRISAGDTILTNSVSKHREVLVSGETIMEVIKMLACKENCLSNIFDGLKTGQTHVSFFCREYWGTTGADTHCRLEGMPFGEKLRRQVRIATSLEQIGLALIAHQSSGLMEGVPTAVRSRLRNLVYYLHQNALILLDLFGARWRARTPESDINLDLLIHSKGFRPIKRGHHVMTLKTHNDLVINVVKQICRSHDRPVVHSANGRRQTSDVLQYVCDLLKNASYLEKCKGGMLRNRLLQFLRFEEMEKVYEDDTEETDIPIFDRFGCDQLASTSPTAYPCFFEPLPPMLADMRCLNQALLPPRQERGSGYTLVLDLDETLVHYVEEENGDPSWFDVRPYCHEFLQLCHSMGWELVVFTAATQDYADWVMGQLDHTGIVAHRLYRQHALPWGPIFVKDLSRLGRDLDKTLIIDNVRENFMFQHGNGIFILPWYHNHDDTALRDLVPLLREIISTRSKVSDVLETFRDGIPLMAGWADSNYSAPEEIYDDHYFEDEMEDARAAHISAANHNATKKKNTLTGAFQSNLPVPSTPNPLRRRR